MLRSIVIARSQYRIAAREACRCYSSASAAASAPSAADTQPDAAAAIPPPPSPQTQKTDWNEKNFNSSYSMDQEFPTASSYVKKLRLFNMKNPVEAKRAYDRVIRLEEQNFFRYKWNRIFVYVCLAACVIVVAVQQDDKNGRGYLSKEDIRELTGLTFRELKEFGQFGPQFEEDFEKLGDMMRQREQEEAPVPPAVLKAMEEKGIKYLRHDGKSITGSSGVIKASFGKLYTFDVEPQRRMFREKMRRENELRQQEMQRAKAAELESDPAEAQRQLQMEQMERNKALSLAQKKKV